MSMRSLRGFIAVAFLGWTLASCGGSTGSSSAPPAAAPADGGGASTSSSSVTFALNTGGQSQTQSLPNAGSVGGSITLVPNPGSPPATVTITSSTAPPSAIALAANVRKAQDESVSVFYYATIVASSTVTMATQPGFVLSVSPNILLPGRSYFYAMSNPTSTDPNTQLSLLARSGTADLTNYTITFPTTTQPLTLVAGLSYSMLFYATASTGGPLSSAVQQQIDSAMNAEITNGDAPGIQIGIAQQGQILYVKGYGNATLPSTPVTPSTTFEIGSVSKQFCATLVLLLQQHGLLNIDDPLSRYIPEYNQAGRFTLRNMLNMVSGVPADVDLWYGPNVFIPVPQSTAIANFNTVPLDFPPTLEYEYSNANYWLLGVVVERVTKMAYADALQKYVLAPLGLSSTYYFGTRTDPNFAQGYTHDKTSPSGFRTQKEWSTDYTFSEGSLVSNVSDLLTWDYKLRTGMLISPQSLATEFAVPNLGAITTSYAMGWVQQSDPSLTWHNGEVAGFHSMNAVYNASGYSIVVLGNTWTESNGCGRYCPEALSVEIYNILTGSSATLPTQLPPN